jgi:DnaJ-class molecular chaperone
MAAVNQAYAVLGDSERRRAYDAHAPTDAPWRADFEAGRELDDWRQMYAEDVHAWQALLNSQPAPETRRQIERALEQALAEQLELESALATRGDVPPAPPSRGERGGCLLALFRV